MVKPTTPKPVPIARRIEYVQLDRVPPALKNPKRHAEPALDASVTRWGYTEPVLLDERTERLVAGHGRIDALKRLRDKELAPPEGVLVDKKSGEWMVPVVRGWSSRSDEEAQAYLLASNQLTISGGWDNDALADMLAGMDAEGALEGVGFSDMEVAKILAEMNGEGVPGAGSLSQKFLVPPFSVLDTRQGYWQERKRAWLSLGIESEVGRKEELTFSSTGMTRDAMEKAGGMTSIFDPVLCELAYRWFSPEGGVVLDPFAGGSVRGIVASRLGRTYHGVDLRGEQVLANRAQAEVLVRKEDPAPTWYTGDSSVVLAEAPLLELQADLVFSCPPYADLEVYSEDPRDLSAMDYVGFRQVYRLIIARAVARLKPNRFACFVVTEVRDSKGLYRGLVPDTIAAFVDAGASFYNEAVLVNSVGSLRLRAGKIFEASRKLGRTHQNVLVFFKGDPKQIRAELGELAVPSEVFEAMAKQEEALASSEPLP